METMFRGEKLKTNYNRNAKEDKKKQRNENLEDQCFVSMV